MANALSKLQSRVLELLAGMAPPWTLSGGGALVGFHLHHRETRDLDLFWRNAETIAESAVEARRRLAAAGLRVDPIQSSATFVRLRVTDGEDVIVLDLVADPVPCIEEPVDKSLGGAIVHVDSPHEILVNKLCTLLGRRELRDLVDVEALVSAGADLQRALQDAPRKDGGFSPLTLAWILRDLPIEEMATAEGRQDASKLAAGRDDLVTRILTVARPPDE